MAVSKMVHNSVGKLVGTLLGKFSHAVLHTEGV